MRSEDWERIETAFHRVRELEGASRAAFLDEFRRTSPDLHAALSEMLPALEPESSILDRPAYSLFTGTAPNPSRDLAGMQVGAYRIVAPIADGGMGSVYRAVRSDDQYQQDVAIKFLRRDLTDDEALKRFLDERQTLAFLEHPNIARLLDGGTTSDGDPYLVLELVDGVPLDQWCHRESLGIGQRIELFLQVCDAIRHAHRNMVIHRDLKPANILVSKEGHPKLLDFGIAKILDPGALAWRAASTIRPIDRMTPQFASPEQIRGENVTAAADVYALGVILFLLLTEQLPYLVESVDRQSLENTVCHRPTILPSETLLRNGTGRTTNGMSTSVLARQLRGDLDAILTKAMQVEAERRYLTIDAFVNDLKLYLKGLPIEARPDSPAYRIRKFVQRNKATTAVTTMLILSLVLGLAGTLVQASRAERKAETALNVTEFVVSLFENADPYEAQEYSRAFRSFLDRAEERLRHELQDEDEIRSDILAMLGRSNLGLSFDEKAVLLLDETIRSLDATGAARDEKYATVLHYLGIAQRRSGEVARAARTHRLALDIRQELTGTDSRESIQSMNVLGLTLLTLPSGREEGRSYLEAALDLARKNLAPSDSLIAFILNNLADQYLIEDQWKLAESHMRDAAEIHRLGDPRGLHLATTLNNLGVVLYEIDRLDDAQSVLEEAANIRATRLGSDHPHFAASRLNLGIVFLLKSDFETAVMHMRKAHDVLGQRHASHHPDVLLARSNLAEALWSSGQRDQAYSLLQDAIATIEASVGTHSRGFVDSTLTLVDLRIRAEEFDLALPLLVRTIAILEVMEASDDNTSDLEWAREREAELRARRAGT